MTLSELKKAARKEKIIIYTVKKITRDGGYWVGYKIWYAVELGSNTVSAETQIEIESNSYAELADNLYKF